MGGSSKAKSPTKTKKSPQSKALTSAEAAKAAKPKGTALALAPSPGAAAPASPADAIRPSKTSAWPSPHPSSARPTPPPQQPSPANSRKNSSGFTPMAQYVEYVPPPMESPRIQELTPGMRDVPAGAPVPPLSIPAAAPEFSPMPQQAPPAGYHAAQQSVPVYSERELLQPAGPPRSFRDGWPHSSVNLGERHKFAAGIGSKELANSLAKTQFVEFVPQKVSRQKVYETDDEVLTSAELVHSWPVRLASSFNSKKALSGAGGTKAGGTDAAMVPYDPWLTSAKSPNQKLAGLGLNPYLFVESGSGPAGVTSHFMMNRVARPALDRHLQDVNLQNVKPRPQNVRRASMSMADNIIYGGEKSAEEKQLSVSRKARRSLCLQPQMTALLGGDEAVKELNRILEKHQRRPSVATIIDLKPKLFAEAAGLSSIDVTRHGMDAVEFKLHDSFDLGGFEGKKPKKKLSLNFRRGSATEDLMRGAGSGEKLKDTSLEIVSSAPEHMFVDAAGITSKKMSLAAGSGEAWIDNPPEIVEYGLDAKHALYGGGEAIFGSAAQLAQQKHDAKRPAIIREKTSLKPLFDGSAGTSSKKAFFFSDHAKTHYYFSENLEFKPCGVKGLGYDAQPQPVEGGAGLSSKEMSAKNSEGSGFMSDEKAAARRGSAQPVLSTEQLKALVASGGSIEEFANLMEEETKVPLIYMGESENASGQGIPDRNPPCFIGAAGLTSHQTTTIALKGQQIGGQDEVDKTEDEAANSPGGGDESPGTKYRRSSMAVADKIPKQPERRGSAINSEGVAVMGGSVLQRVRKDRAAPTMSMPEDGNKMWEGMPDGFDGAAGLSSQASNWVSTRDDPVIKEMFLMKQKEEQIRKGDFQVEAPPQEGGRPNARRNSTIQQAGPSVFAGIEDTEKPKPKDKNAVTGKIGNPDNVSEAKKMRALRSANAWEGMPASFKGAAGVSTRNRAFFEAQSDPANRLPTTPRRNDQRDWGLWREENPAAGLTSNEITEGALLMKTFSEQRAWWENPVPAVGGFEAQEVIYGHQQRQESAAHRSDPLAQMRHNSNLSERDYGMAPAARPPPKKSPESDGVTGKVGEPVPAFKDPVREVWEAYPQSFVGAAGLTSGQVDRTQTRATRFLQGNTNEQLNKKLSSWMGVMEAQREMEEQGMPGSGGRWSAGRGDMSGRGTLERYLDATQPQKGPDWQTGQSPHPGGQTAFGYNGTPRSGSGASQRAHVNLENWGDRNNRSMSQQRRLTETFAGDPKELLERRGSVHNHDRRGSINSQVSHHSQQRRLTEVGSPHQSGPPPQQAHRERMDPQRMDSPRERRPSRSREEEEENNAFTPIQQMSSGQPTASPRHQSPQQRFEREPYSPRRPSGSDSQRSFLESYWNNFAQTRGGQQAADTDRSVHSARGALTPR